MSSIKTFNEHRRSTNPQEDKMFEVASKWKEQNNVIFDQAILGCHGSGNPKDYLTERETQIVFTTLQWLGSPVGQGFLAECGFELFYPKLNVDNFNNK